MMEVDIHREKIKTKACGGGVEIMETWSRKGEVVWVRRIGGGILRKGDLEDVRVLLFETETYVLGARLFVNY